MKYGCQVFINSMSQSCQLGHFYFFQHNPLIDATSEPNQRLMTPAKL